MDCILILTNRGEVKYDDVEGSNSGGIKLEDVDFVVSFLLFVISFFSPIPNSLYKFVF
jgi:hypothetical protein